MRTLLRVALAMAGAALGGCSALAPEPPPPPRVWKCTARRGYRVDSGWGYYSSWRYDHYRQGDCRTRFTIVE